MRTYNDIDHITPVIWKSVRSGWLTFFLFVDKDYSEDYRIRFLEAHGAEKIRSISIEWYYKRVRRSIYKHVNSGGSFGANPLRQTIGLGKATQIETLEIFWPTSGLTQTFRHIPTDQFIKIIEGETQIITLKLKK